MVGMLGGYKHVEDHQNDASVQNAANFAVKEISQQTNSQLELVKVASAHKQVVAGLNYQLVLETANQAQEKVNYEAVVYEPLGQAALQLTSHKRVSVDEAQRKTEESHERGSGALLGGYREVSSSDPEVTEAARYAAEQLSQQSNSLYPFEVLEVLEAKEKIVAGKQYDMKLKLKQGNLPESIVQVEVVRSLPQNHYSLGSHKTISSAQQ
jgi:flavin-binding protein dodecin